VDRQEGLILPSGYKLLKEQTDMKVKFWKMHGIGNDFIVIDDRHLKLEEIWEPGEISKRLCRRRFSIGADGVLLICEPTRDDADVRMRILNPDGSEAEMCGNGIRCLAKYCYENGIVKRNHIRIETLAGVKDVWLRIEDGEIVSVRVDMGKPILERRLIPMLGEGICINEELKVGGETFRVTCLSLGNPHCVIFVDDPGKVKVTEVGPKIEHHSLFPKGVNVEFVRVMGRDELEMRVWERSVGETLACGTGACASVVAGNILGKVDSRCVVHLPGGDLEVEYEGGRLWMTGPVERVYEGTVNLSEVMGCEVQVLREG